MKQVVRNAGLAALVVIIVTLVYTKIPGVTGLTATTTPAVATTTEAATSSEEATSTAPMATSTPASHAALSGPTLVIAGKTIRLTVATTPEEREQGLSGRQGLAKDEGMLFVFKDDGRYAFWMKDMLFSIDMVWISAAGKVVDFKENVAPDTYPASFAPEASARYVLELPAGFAKLYNLQKGDFVKI